MPILSQLQVNKGTTSSALGKELAADVLAGNNEILHEAIELVHHDDKNVRAGAAKIVEKVAEEKPELVAPSLQNLLPALDQPEFQTRWMIIHVMGLCAELNPEVALSAGSHIPELLSSDSVALQDRAITYLGYIGALSPEEFTRVFPILCDALEAIPKRASRVLESLVRCVVQANGKQSKVLMSIAERYADDESGAVKTQVRKLVGVVGRER